MRKKSFISLLFLIVSIPTFAGGLLTNTNHSAAYLRTLSREGVIALDGVYNNPAGIAFMPKGFYLSLNWQAAFQKRQITSTSPAFAFGEGNNGNPTKFFEGTATAPVIPSFQAAYILNDKWSFSTEFSVAGGGGKCDFDEGLGSFEALIGGQIMGAGVGATGYALNQYLTGEQYIYGFQLGATYKFNDHLSVFLGGRGVKAMFSYEGAVKDIQIKTAQGGFVPASDYFKGVAGQLMAAGLPETHEKVIAAKKASFMLNDLTLNCDQSYFGYTPIIGLDWNYGNLNIGAKYEFRTHMNLKNKSKNSPNVDAVFPDYADGNKVRADIPAILSVGAQYLVLPSVRLHGGFVYYFDNDAEGSATAVQDNTWEASFATEWQVNKKWLVSGGVRRTQYGFADSDMSDISFNISSTGIGLGGAYRISNKTKIDFGYYHTFYDHHDANPDKMGLTSHYTRKNDVIGLGLDITF